VRTQILLLTYLLTLLP